MQGDLERRLAFYDHALKLAPDAIEALVSRAGLLMDPKRFDGAANDVEALRSTSPADPRGACLGALLAARAGDKATMLAALAKVTGLLDPVPIEYLRLRSRRWSANSGTTPTTPRPSSCSRRCTGHRAVMRAPPN